MPNVDVSEILTDPDLVDDFQVVRSVRSVNSSGLTVDSPGCYYTFGNIQPTSGASLNMLPETERVGSFITVVTQFGLRALTATTAPDQIIFNGNYYRVITLNDWGQYGNGFVSAICRLTGMVEDGPC